jgi:hypothetical protein
MAAPNDPGPDPQTAGHDPSNTDEPTIRAEEELQDAETGREAREEAERLNAVPYGKVAKEGGGTKSGSQR